MSRLTYVVWGLLGCGLAGCAGSPIEAPKFDAGTAGRQAAATCDANGDGVLDKAELAKCPALLAALPRIDKDNSGTLTEAEIAARIGTYGDLNVALLPFKCVVLLDDQPLVQATVTLVPEKFLGDASKLASGVTDKAGNALLSIPEHREQGLAGVHCGLYRVEIRKEAGGQDQVPAKYNTETTLGQEVAFDVPELERGVTLKLSSK